MAISDRYITWGWTNGNSKHYPLGIIKNIERRTWRYDSSGELLIVTNVMPRYSYVMGSFPITTKQVAISLQDQYNFVNNLNNHIF